MKITTLFVCLALVASQANSIELGAGLAAYHESKELTPFLSVGINPYRRCEGSEYTSVYINWSRDEERHHTNVIYTYPFWESRQQIKTYFDLGAGMKWQDFDRWEPELAFGLSACGPVLGVTTRVAWTHLEAGGLAEPDDVFSAGVYFGRPKWKPEPRTGD